MGQTSKTDFKAAGLLSEKSVPSGSGKIGKGKKK